MCARSRSPGAARGLPYYILRDHCGQMADRLAETGRAGCDLAFADSLHTATYVSRLPVPKILQQHNVESFLIQGMLGSHRNPLVRAAGPVERRNLEAFERDQCNAFDAVIALSDTDAARLRGLGVRVPVAVIPPAVEPAEPIPEGPKRRHIVHIGTGTWPPIDEGLRWYIWEVLPHIRREAPGAETLLAGPPPKDRRSLDGEGGIRALGYMEDLEPVYLAAAVFVVPLLVGGGVRLKILHALARGLAVVSTSAGCEGLGTEHGRHLCEANWESAVVLSSWSTSIPGGGALDSRPWRERWRPANAWGPTGYRIAISPVVWVGEQRSWSSREKSMRKLTIDLGDERLYPGG